MVDYKFLTLNYMSSLYPSAGFLPIVRKVKKDTIEKKSDNKKREAQGDTKKLVNIKEVLEKRKAIPFLSLGQSNLGSQ